MKRQIVELAEKNEEVKKLKAWERPTRQFVQESHWLVRENKKSSDYVSENESGHQQMGGSSKIVTIKYLVNKVRENDKLSP